MLFRSCRGQEGRRGSEEAVLGPSVFPSREPGMSVNFWARNKTGIQNVPLAKLTGLKAAPVLCVSYLMDLRKM